MYTQTQILQASCWLTWGDLLPQSRDLCAPGPVILSIIPALCSPQQAGRGVLVLLTVLADGLTGVRLHRSLCVCLL